MLSSLKNVCFVEGNYNLRNISLDNGKMGNFNLKILNLSYIWKSNPKYANRNKESRVISFVISWYNDIKYWCRWTLKQCGRLTLNVKRKIKERYWDKRHEHETNEIKKIETKKTKC